MLGELLVKELAMLLLLAAVGAVFARMLQNRLDAGSQLALAPVFGFAAAISLLTTLNFFLPLRNALWFALLPAAAVSLHLALRQGGPPRSWRPHVRTFAQLAIVLTGILAIANAPLAHRDSPGPIAWGIFDAPVYTDCISGFRGHTTRDPLLGDITEGLAPSHDDVAWEPKWDLGLRYCWSVKFFHNGAETLPAALTGPLGWPAWQLIAPVMALFMVLTGLGTYAIFRLVTRSQSWLSIAPGLAMGGAPLFQLYIDGSAGLLAGIALIPALLAVGTLGLRRLSWRTTFLGALLLAGLVAAYAEMGAIVVGSLIVAALGRLAASVRAGEQPRAVLRRGLPHLVAVGALAVLLAPRAALWALASLIATGSVAERVIEYQMQFLHLPGWLLQTREFYTFALTAPHGFTYVTVGVLLPLALIAVAIYGFARRRDSWLLLVVIGVAAVQALYAASVLSCSYCVGRTLATVVPAVAVLVAIGVLELTRSTSRWRFALGAALGSVAVAAAGASLLSIEQRAYRGAYMPPASLEKVSEVASRAVDGPLQLEGFGQTPLWAWGEMPVTYQAAIAATGHRVSLVPAYNDYGGLSYNGTRPPGHPSYTPDYGYVLTRLGSIDTGRPVLFRSGTLTLERRAGVFDATVARGVAVETYLRDRSGTAWVQRPGSALGLDQGPLTFWVSALSPAPAYLRATFAGPPDLRPSGVRGAVRTRLGGGRTRICMPIPGRGRLRIATLPLLPLPAEVTFPPAEPGSTTLPDENAPYVARETRLDKVRLSTRSCAKNETIHRLTDGRGGNGRQ